jgi:anti-sigma B factor antagonist
MREAQVEVSSLWGHQAGGPIQRERLMHSTRGRAGRPRHHHGSPLLSDQFPPKPFRCDLEDAGGGTARIRPAGELDMATVDQLEECFREAHGAGFRRIVADLRSLEFMDSTGLTLLTRWTLEAQRDGYEFAVVPGDERVRRLFELTGLAPHFTFLDE